ncbi:MAG: PEP-CTERM sorting domain-containing protein [Limisphaerales bacterium]
MKKSIFIAVLGLTAGIASSYGQGFVGFSSYLANGTAGATTTIFGGSTLVPAGYTAALYYFIGTVSDPVDNNSIASITSLPIGLTALGFTQSFATGSATAGYFDGGAATIPGYTAASGPITFEVVAYNGASYDTSTIRGRSGSFTMTGIATGNQGVPYLGDNGTAMPNFFVAPVPEPTTLALVGLGGLASLVAFRRKQA